MRASQITDFKAIDLIDLKRPGLLGATAWSTFRWLRNGEEVGSIRLFTRAQDARHELGGSMRLFDPFPAKPKPMRWWTYERLEAEDNRACRLLHEVWRVASTRLPRAPKYVVDIAAGGFQDAPFGQSPKCPSVSVRFVRRQRACVGFTQALPEFRLDHAAATGL